jgi:transposase
MHALLDGRKVILIWDGLPSHRSRRMKDWLATQRSWLRVEQLPGYAYDLNPIEGVWGNLKGQELANLCPDTINEAAQRADEGLSRIGSETELCLAFLHHTGLKL